MKRFATILFGISLGIVSLWGFSSVGAQQAELTDEQLSLIVRNCQNTKVTLERLHSSDALLRVNRGQAYESLSIRLMDNFNSRLSSNGLDKRAMETVSASYKSTLDSFRSNYKSYEETLSATLKIDCQKNPASFHYSIESAREKRKKIHEDVQRLHRYVDDYRDSIDDFMINFERKDS